MKSNEKMYIKPPYNLKIPMTNTCKHLMRALYRLVSKQAFNTIFVKEICDEASVSRSNFYNHFEDKYHLLLFYLNTVPAQLENKIDFNQDSMFFQSFLEHIEKHKAFFYSLISNDNGEELTSLLRSVLNEEIHNFLWAKNTLNETFDEEALDIETVFLTGGVDSIIQWWIINNFELSYLDITEIIDHFMLSASNSYFKIKE